VEERKLALERLPPKKKDAHNIDPRSLAKRLLKSPTIYVLTSLSLVSAMLEAFAFQGMFLLWLKHNASRFSQTAINTYPLGIQAVAIASQIGAGIWIDRTGQRLPMIIFAACIQLVTASLLLVRDLPDAGVFTAHYLSGTSFIVNPVMYGWASTICVKTGDDAARSVVLYAMAMAGQLLYTWWGIVLYPATDVPYWQKGAAVLVVVCFVYVGMGFVVRWLDRKTTRMAVEKEGSEGEGERVVALEYPTKTG
jgi:ACS family pantothenate transporter-like MFS transporter